MDLEDARQAAFATPLNTGPLRLPNTGSSTAHTRSYI
jgi:hypothetical protein